MFYLVVKLSKSNFWFSDNCNPSWTAHSESVSCPVTRLHVTTHSKNKPPTRTLCKVAACALPKLSRVSGDMFSIDLCRQFFPIQAPVDSMMESGGGLAQRWFCARAGPGFLSRPESKYAHQSLLSCLTFLFTIQRKCWNCSLEALQKDAIIVSKSRHMIAETLCVAWFTLIYEWQFRVVISCLYLFSDRQYENIGFLPVFFQWQVKFSISCILYSIGQLFRTLTHI